jgi:hypothetical protein
MPVRVAIICACALGFGILQAGLAAAEDLDPGQTRALVVGKLFSYTCFDGTAGLGRIFGDGSVVGTIRLRGEAETRFAALPPGTIRVDGPAVCANLSGLRRASGCRRSITGASAARSLDWTSPIATSISEARERTWPAARLSRRLRLQ